MRNRSYYESSCPLQVMAKNETIQPKQISLFGSEFNDFENKDAQSCFTYGTYSYIQKALLNTIYGIGVIRIMLQTKNSKGNFDTKKSKENLKNLIILINNKDINGQELTMPLVVENHINPKQFQKNIADIEHEIYLGGSVALNFTLPPKTEVIFTLFPFYKNKIGIETYHGKRGLTKMIENIRHPFSEILINKIKEADKLRNSYKADEEVNTINNYYSSGYKGFFNEKIHTLLVSLTDIPSDLYRNMVNLYVELEDYINEIIKESEYFVDNLDSLIPKSIINKKTNRIVKKSPAKKVVKKKISNQKKDTIHAINLARGIADIVAKNVVKKVTKKVSKK